MLCMTAATIRLESDDWFGIPLTYHSSDGCADDLGVATMHIVAVQTFTRQPERSTFPLDYYKWLPTLEAALLGIRPPLARDPS